MPYILLIIYLAAALALQFMTGSFPVSFMAFPLNLIFFMIWFAGMLWIWRAGRRSLFVRFILSPGATFTAIGLLLVSVLVMGFTGWRWVASTWFFVALMLYFQTVLLFVILRGWREATATGARLGAVRWRFVFLHAGLLVAVASAFWGAPDSETLRVKAERGGQLKDFVLEFSSEGIPSMFKAVVDIDGKEVELQVNHPYNRRFGEDVYLLSYDASAASGDEVRYCVLQIVREPWKYGAAAGIVMILAGALMLFVGGPRRNNSNDWD